MIISADFPPEETENHFLIHENRNLYRTKAAPHADTCSSFFGGVASRLMAADRACVFSKARSPSPAAWAQSRSRSRLARIRTPLDQ